MNTITIRARGDRAASVASGPRLTSRPLQENLARNISGPDLGRAFAASPVSGLGQAAGAVSDAIFDTLRAERAEEEDRLARERRDAQELFEANWRNRQLEGFELSLVEERDRLAREGDPTDPGFADSLRRFADDRLTSLLEGAGNVSPESQEAVRARAQSSIIANYETALATAREANRAAARDGFDQALNRLSNEVFRQPGALDDQLQRFETRLSDFVGRDPDVERDFLSAGRARIVRSALNGLIDQDQFDAAERLVNSGRFDADLAPETVEGIDGAIETGRARFLKEIETRRKERRQAMEAEAEERAESAIARAGETGRFDPAAFDFAADVLGEEEATRLEERAIRAGNVRRLTESVTTLAPEEADRTLRALKPDPDDPGYEARDTFADDLADYEKLVANVRAFQRELQNDPAAAVEDAVSRELDRYRRNEGAGAGPDAEAAYAGRIRAREQRKRGLARPRFTTNREASSLVEEFERGNVGERLAFLEGIRTRYGADGDRVLLELSDVGLPGVAELAGFFVSRDRRHVAADILAGNANPSKAEIMPSATDFDPAIAAAFGDLFRAAPAALGSYREAVEALYVADAQRAGAIAGTFDEERFARAVERVTGGVLDWNGRALLPPFPGLEQAEFDRALGRLAPDDISGAVFADGSAVDPEDVLDDLGFATVGPGQYLLEDLDGRPVMNAGDGLPYVLDLAALWPRLTDPDPGRDQRISRAQFREQR